MARCPENHFPVTKKDAPPLVTGIQQIHRQERKGLRRGSGRSGMASGKRRWPPTMKPTGKKEVIEADMVLLAGLPSNQEQPTFAENVFVAGDAANGAKSRSTCTG